MADPTTIQLNIVANATSAEQALGKLANAIGRVKTAIGKGMNLDSVATGIGKIVTALSTGISEDAVSRLERAAAALNQMKGIGTVNVRVTAGSMSPINNIKDSLTQAADSAKDVRSGLEQTGDAVKDVGAKSDESAKEVVKLSDRLKELAQGSKNVKSGLGALISQFFRIMKMRAIRYVIREITKSIKEGLDNYKEYSKAIGGSYYKAVTSANDAMLKMKNSIGAALAPAIQMLIPYIQRAVNWFINLMNIVNQFLALLNGQATWSKAVDVSSEAFEKTKKGAKGASSAIKELLADWDELNIIQSESGSGGGGGVGKDAYDYTQMFTEVDKFDEKIRNTVQWIKDNMDLVKRAAELIGVAIAGWSISTLFGGTLGTLIGWATTGVIGAAVFNLTFKLNEKYLEDGKPGWLLGNILATAFGAGIAGKLMTRLTGSATAAATAVAIILTVSATADLVAAIGKTDVSALDTKNLSLALLSALKLGLATTFMAHAFAGMGWGGAAVVGLGATGLVFGAEVGIKAVIGDIQTGEITLESVAAKAISALTIGTGAFLVAKGAGLELAESAVAGLAALGVIATLYLGFDLVVGKVRKNNITLESVLKIAGQAAAAALGFRYLGKLGILPPDFATGGGMLAAAGFVVALTLGIRATIGALTNPEEITVSDLLEIAGSGVAAALGAAGMTNAGIIPGEAVTNALAAGGFFISILLGIRVALEKTATTSGIDEGTIIKTATGAVGMAIALTSATKDMGIGVLGAGIYATVLLGIRVVKGAVDAGSITAENINAALGVGTLGGIVTAGALMKAGAAITTVAIGGVAGGLAIATGLIAIAAISIALATQKDGISWYGSETLSEQEVRAFVETKMFNADAKVNLSLIEDQITITEGQKKKIAEDAKKAIGTIQAVRLSINESESLIDMYGQVTTLLTNIKTYAKTQKTTLATNIAMVPIIDSTGVDVSKKFLSSGLAGWQGITDYMGRLGDELAQAMIDETTGKLKSDWDVEAVKTIMEKVQKISEAVNGTQMTADATAALKVSTMGLKDLSKDSVDEVLNYYSEFEQQLREGYTKMYTSNYTEWKTMASIYMGMAEAELAAGNKELSEKYRKEAEKLNADAEELLSHLGTSVEDSVHNAGVEGRKIIKEWIDSVFTLDTNVQIDDNEIGAIFNRALQSDGVMHAMQAASSKVTGIPIKALEMLNITGWDYLTEDMRNQLLAALSQSLNGDQMIDVLTLLGLDPENFSSINNEIRQWVKDTYDPDLGPALVLNTALEKYGNEYYKVILDALMAQSGLDIDQILANINEANAANGITLDEFTNMVEVIRQYKKDLETGPSAPDTSAFKDGMEDLKTSAQTTADSVRASFNSLNGLTIGFSGGLFGGRINVTVPRVQFMASGGFPDVGEMFIARENGMNEMIGRIGSRSAVANNDQIVNSIQGGVEAGMRNANDGTDQLLGQAVALLGQILRKTGTYQPSASHGRVIKQSLDMYARSGG